jgi:very-short-patch-repair endonuclease
MGQVDSEFEAEVAGALRQRGLFVLHQYPACGFHIDLVCEREGTRVAVECDGERYHLDEHGQPKLEDLEREAILRRAGWRIVRIPYRKWLQDPAGEVRAVLEALGKEQQAQEEEVTDDSAPATIASGANAAVAVPPAKVMNVNATQEAILRALREGLTDEERILYRVRDLLGARRLTAPFRRLVLGELQQLNHQGLVTREDQEYFPTPEARTAQLRVLFERSFRHRSRRYRRWR